MSMSSDGGAQGPMGPATDSSSSAPTTTLLSCEDLIRALNQGDNPVELASSLLEAFRAANETGNDRRKVVAELLHEARSSLGNRPPGAMPGQACLEALGRVLHAADRLDRAGGFRAWFEKTAVQHYIEGSLSFNEVEMGFFAFGCVDPLEMDRMMRDRVVGI